MRVKALQYMYYDRREHQAGEEYDMDDREEASAKLLQTLGKIEIISGPGVERKAPPAPTYQAAAVKAEPEPVEEGTQAGPMTTDSAEGLVGGERKRTYRRRDMRSEK